MHLVSQALSTKQLWIRGGGKSGIHLAEVSVFARMIGKKRHFRDLSQQLLSGVVASGCKNDFLCTLHEKVVTMHGIFFFFLQFYPDKNHGLRGGGTSDHLYHLLTRFLLQKLSISS